MDIYKEGKTLDQQLHLNAVQFLNFKRYRIPLNKIVKFDNYLTITHLKS